MTATLILQGAFLWLTSAAVSGLVWCVVLARSERRRAWESSPAAVCERQRAERHARRYAHLEEIDHG